MRIRLVECWVVVSNTGVIHCFSQKEEKMRERCDFINKYSGFKDRPFRVARMREDRS